MCAPASIWASSIFWFMKFCCNKRWKRNLSLKLKQTNAIKQVKEDISQAILGLVPDVAVMIHKSHWVWWKWLDLQASPSLRLLIISAFLFIASLPKKVIPVYSISIFCVSVIPLNMRKQNIRNFTNTLGDWKIFCFLIFKFSVSEHSLFFFSSSFTNVPFRCLKDLHSSFSLHLFCSRPPESR